MFFGRRPKALFIIDVEGINQESLEDPVFPPLDIYATNEFIFIEAELPGINPEDIEIRVKGNQLTLQGIKRSDIRTSKKVSFIRSERFMGPFRREVKLPAEVHQEEIKALYKKGVLYIEVPLSFKRSSIVEIEEE